MKGNNVKLLIVMLVVMGRIQTVSANGISTCDDEAGEYRIQMDLNDVPYPQVALEYRQSNSKFTLKCYPSDTPDTGDYTCTFRFRGWMKPPVYQLTILPPSDSTSQRVVMLDGVALVCDQ